ncbi:Uncharacterised protein [Mycobacteroides abscessus subsp. abscessus]|nr:Uncharacterised protein [Mycobacteroides abscessus subsp. abscessus]
MLSRQGICELIRHHFTKHGGIGSPLGDLLDHHGLRQRKRVLDGAHPDDDRRAAATEIFRFSERYRRPRAPGEQLLGCGDNLRDGVCQ